MCPHTDHTTLSHLLPDRPKSVQIGRGRIQEAQTDKAAGQHCVWGKQGIIWLVKIVKARSPVFAFLPDTCIPKHLWTSPPSWCFLYSEDVVVILMNGTDLLDPIPQFKREIHPMWTTVHKVQCSQSQCWSYLYKCVCLLSNSSKGNVCHRSLSQYPSHTPASYHPAMSDCIFVSTQINKIRFSLF